MILEAKSIYKSYKSPEGKLSVIKNLDLSIEEGQMIFIVGRSGSGKSTLLHVLGNLDRLDSGAIFFQGKPVHDLSEEKRSEFRRRQIGFVFQFYHLLPELTLYENVLLAGIIAKRKKREEKANALLEEVGLTNRRRHFPHQLSGGEQQRGALVRALMNDPQLVFCDEPTGNLDEENSGVIIELLKKLNKEKKQTFCIVTHDENFSKQGDVVYRLSGGMLSRS